MKKRKPKRRNEKILFSLFFVLLLACQSSEDQIRQTLNRREEAFEKKDLSLYLSCISQDYEDKDGRFPELRKRMEAYFKSFGRIEYDCWDRSIQIEGEVAKATQQFQLEVEKGGKVNRYSGKEAFLLRKEGGGWKIFKGL